MTSLRILILVLALSPAFLSSTALGQADPDRLRKLEEAVQQLQQQNEALQREVQQLKAVPAPSAKPPGSGTNWWTDALDPKQRTPFALPLGKELKLKLGGFVQAQGEFGDAGSFEGNFSDNPLNVPGRSPVNDRFRLRRARINVSGEFREDFDFKAEGEFSQGDGLAGGRTGFSGTDIFINWNHFREAQVKVGQWKAPFGLEQLTSDTALFTAERSLATSILTPERQIGIALWGKPFTRVGPKGLSDLVDYSVGMFNGNGRNITVNDNDNFLYAARIGLTPYKGSFHGEPVTWRLGANGYTARFAGGTRISQSGSLLLSPLDGSLTPFVAAGSARGEGWGVDQWLTVGPFDLVAEYLEASFHPISNTSFNEFVANGYYVQGSYFLPYLGGKRLQLVGRWESFNPGQAADDDIQSVIGGLNYYINGDALKLMLNYIHTWSEFRDHNPGTGDAEFDLAVLRMQLMF